MFQKKETMYRNYEEIGESQVALIKVRERRKRRDKGKSYVVDERV